MLHVPSTFYCYKPPADSFGYFTTKRSLNKYLRANPSNVFAYLDINFQWTYCREVFYGEANRELFFFRHLSDQRGNVSRFIKIIEKRLKLKDGIKFIETDEKEVTAVQTTKFWQDRVTCSLLTILLRAGRYYDSSFKRSLGSEEYLVQTMPAVKRFLNGFTKFTGRTFFGWRDAFMYTDDKKLEKLLVCPQ